MSTDDHKSVFEVAKLIGLFYNFCSNWGLWFALGFAGVPCTLSAKPNSRKSSFEVSSLLVLIVTILPVLVGSSYSPGTGSGHYADCSYAAASFGAGSVAGVMKLGCDSMSGTRKQKKKSKPKKERRSSHNRFKSADCPIDESLHEPSSGQHQDQTQNIQLLGSSGKFQITDSSVSLKTFYFHLLVVVNVDSVTHFQCCTTSLHFRTFHRTKEPWQHLLHECCSSVHCYVGSNC
jgi:hypothetical protein